MWVGCSPAAAQLGKESTPVPVLCPSTSPSTPPHLQARSSKPDAADMETFPKEPFPEDRLLPPSSSLSGLTSGTRHRPWPRGREDGRAGPSMGSIRPSRPEPSGGCGGSRRQQGWGVGAVSTHAKPLGSPALFTLLLSEVPLRGSKLLPPGLSPGPSVMEELRLDRGCGGLAGSLLQSHLPQPTRTRF